MKSKLIHENQGQKTFALIFDTGDEAMAGLVEFARQNQLGASHFTAIGAFKDVTLGYFDWSARDYEKIVLREQVEVLSLTGDVALHEGKPKIHAHVVVGKRDGSEDPGGIAMLRKRIHISHQPATPYRGIHQSVTLWSAGA